MPDFFSSSSFFFFLFSFSLYFFSPPTLSLPHEAHLLSNLTRTLSDPDRFFSAWTGVDPCKWTGVGCDKATGSVTSLDLSYANVAGEFPIELCSLPSLSYLSLSNNNVGGSLPSDVSTCRNLTHIDLSQNLFVGDLPESLASIEGLVYLDLSGNNFSGEVPASFGRFKKLEVISLVDNLLDGKFPSFLGNVSTLKTLNLTNNPFRPGVIGPELGNLTGLEVFWAEQCNLVGEIPDSLSRLGKLAVLDLSKNGLTGMFPGWITKLTGLTQLELYENNLSGELPASGWSELTGLRYFDAAMNRLNGTIPDELTRLPLASLNLYQNSFEGEVPASIADSPNLYELKLFANRLSGELPRKLGQNSPLTIIDVTGNNISGEIPAGLCSQGKLEELILTQNSFTGEIPQNLSDCKSLNRVRLGNNRLTGKVPENFWGLPHVSLLELLHNSLSGEVPKTISSASNLSEIDISYNNFTGTLPDEVGSLTNLVSFVAGNNLFSGPLPAKIVNLHQLGRLVMNDNQLSGSIPPEINSMSRLTDLNLANNKFSGEIPPEIGSLSLNYLDLSGNQFSGEIPLQLQNLKLNQLNLSNNHLTGEIPPLFATEDYRDSFLGNPGLCGDISGLCENRVVKKQSYLWLLRSIFVLAAVIFVVGIIWFYMKYKNFKQEKRAIDKSKWSLTSFHKLGFSEYEILECLFEDNVIGAGGSGKVYKAVLGSGEVVAVKKLWGTTAKVGNGGDLEKGTVQDDGFDTEVETLGKIRHKNIVRLWCCCRTKDCKLLVYEYMTNGSLGDLLHSSKGGLLLDWGARYKIALDAAEGLSYLHHDCVPPIVHRDVKSNNILLDADFGAKVADFGVAKVVEEPAAGKGAKTMSVIAGSCGYIAPEYAYTLRVNEKSDIYSFGVVLLELVTGKRPVDPEYGEKDLVKWVCTTMDQKGVDHVLDPNLDSCFKDQICKVLNIGLLCTSSLPINRPSMRRVVKMLLEVAGENPSKSGKKDGRLTPYYPEDASETGSIA